MIIPGRGVDVEVWVGNQLHPHAEEVFVAGDLPVVEAFRSRTEVITAILLMLATCLTPNTSGTEKQPLGHFPPKAKKRVIGKR